MSDKCLAIIDHCRCSSCGYYRTFFISNVTRERAWVGNRPCPSQTCGCPNMTIEAVQVFQKNGGSEVRIINPDFRLQNTDVTIR